MNSQAVQVNEQIRHKVKAELPAHIDLDITASRNCHLHLAWISLLQKKKKSDLDISPAT